MNKILIRTWQRDDAEALVAVANNKNIWNNVRDHLPNPYTVMDAMHWIARCKEQDPVLNFAVTYNNKIAGSIGCVPQTDIYKKNIEVGYFTGEQFWSKGIATEALRLLLEYITLRFDVIRIYAYVHENNKASMKVLQKNGFFLESIRRRSVVKNNIILDDYVWVKLL